jgi:lipoprotein-anchoring transpeptidase ErfK/SrfK
MKFVLLTLAILSVRTWAVGSLQEVERIQQATQELAPSEIRGINIQQNDVTYWSKYFDNIIVVNKSPDVQRVQVYRFGQPVPNETSTKQGTVERWKVSTGLEIWKCEPLKDTAGNVVGIAPVWTGTPNGYYISKRLDVDHHSASFDDASMRWAAFFNGGIATHRGDEPDKFGVERASHGCVRMTETDARDIFLWTLLSGGPINLEDPRFKGDCPSPQRKSGAKLEKCLSDAEGRTTYFQKTIRASLTEGQTHGLPYASLPQIPDVTRSGKATKWTTGFKTIVIVECVNNDGSDCTATTRAPKISCDQNVPISDQPRSASNSAQPQSPSQVQVSSPYAVANNPFDAALNKLIHPDQWFVAPPVAPPAEVGRYAEPAIAQRAAPMELHPVPPASVTPRIQVAAASSKTTAPVAARPKAAAFSAWPKGDFDDN